MKPGFFDTMEADVEREQLRALYRCHVGVDWLSLHSPWLQEKPRIKVYVSMRSGKTCLGAPYKLLAGVPRLTDYLEFGSDRIRRTSLCDRDGNMFGVGISVEASDC